MFRFTVVFAVSAMLFAVPAARATDNLASIGNLATVAVQSLVGAPARRGNAYLPNVCDDSDDSACVPLFGDRDLIGWIDGGLQSGTFDNRGTQSGGDYDGYFISGGVDYPLRNLGLIGSAGLSGGYSSVHSDLNDGSETRTKLGSVVGYYQYQQTPGAYVNVAFGYAFGSAELTRLEPALQAPGTPFTASADPDLQAWLANALVGWDHQEGAFSFGPFVNWQVGSIHVDSYTETNQGDIREAVESQSVLINVGQLGGRVQYVYEDEEKEIILIPQLRVAFEHDFGDGGRTVKYTRIATNGMGQENVPDSESSALRLGTTLTGEYKDRYILTVGYDGRLLSDAHTSHAFTGNFRIRF